MCTENKNVSIQNSNDCLNRNLNSMTKWNKVKKVFSVFLAAVLFGITAVCSGYGTKQLLVHVADKTDSSNLLTVSSEKGSNTNALNVTDIAASGLSSVVSVTNISVQEVENYFGNWRGNRSRGFPNSQMEETVSCGSGIIIYEEDSQLYMVTNYHVIEGASTLSVTFADDETYEAVICGYDENVDLAVIKVDSSELSESTKSQLSIVEIGNSDTLQVGEQVVAIGNALGYGQSVTTGIVSAVNRTLNDESNNSNGNSFRNSNYENSSVSTSYIQTDAAINPGNSGGALLNMKGELIGINTAKISSTEVEGIGYSIPISQVLDLIESMM